MRWICVIAAFAFVQVAAPVGAAQNGQCRAIETPKQKADEETVRRIEAAWLTAELHGNVDYLQCLLDPSYRVISAKAGTIGSKSDLLRRVALSKGKSAPVPPLATIVVVNGAMATALTSVTGHKANGESYQFQAVDSYVFKNGAWRAVAGVDL